MKGKTWGLLSFWAMPYSVRLDCHFMRDGIASESWVKPGGFTAFSVHRRGAIES